MKWVVMCSPTCMVAYTPGRFYDPVDTTNEPSSCLLPRGNEARSVAQGMSLVMNLSSSISNQTVEHVL